MGTGQAVLRGKFRASVHSQEIITAQRKLAERLIQEVRKITQALSGKEEWIREHPKIEAVVSSITYLAIWLKPSTENN